MLILSTVTLFAIDCKDPQRVIDAIWWSTRFVRFAEIVLLTDTKRHPTCPRAFNHGKAHLPIRVIHHEQSDRMVPCPRAAHYPLPIDYELASLCEPSRHVTTDHFLFFEWDSAICNPWAWDNGWLHWDYIGAPWPQFHEEGWTPCDGHTNNVGNGGFSLRSLRYARATLEMTKTFAGDPAMISSDMYPCLNKRPWLESKGIRFAPDHVASRFSCENLPYAGSFGMHGKWTLALNNWQGRFATIRP